MLTTFKKIFASLDKCSGIFKDELIFIKYSQTFKNVCEFKKVHEFNNGS